MIKEEFKPPTVEELLNGISYEVDPLYVPTDFALEFVNFIKLVEGGESENKTPVVHYHMLDNFVDPTGLDTINMCHRGLAKALALDTKIFTPTGFTTIGNLNIGDLIIGEDGKPTKVITKSEIFDKPMYRITLADGRTLDVSEDHINTVIHRRTVRVTPGRKGKKVTQYQRRDLTTLELLGYTLQGKRNKTAKNPKGREYNFYIPNSSPVKFETKELPIDPYTFGLILGDASISKETGFARLHTHTNDMDSYLSRIPYKIGKIYKRDTNNCTFGILGLGKILKSLGLNVHGDYKFVPQDYLYGDIHQRTELLKGLMDTDGTVTKDGCPSFTSNSLDLCEAVQHLIRSLGGTASITDYGKHKQVNIKCGFSIFHLERKKERETTYSTNKVGIESIVKIPTTPSQCIQVDNKSKTFLANEFVVTHNSTLKEYLILYLAVFNVLPGFGLVPYALYVSDSIDNGVKKMRKSLEFKWNNSQFLQTYLPEIRFTDIRWEFINKAGKSFVVSGYGAKTGVRGTRENGSRPVLALLDDLISDSDARSATVIADVEDTVYKAIDYALHPQRRKIIWSGTPFNAKDPLYKAVESGAWAVNVYPVCEHFPCDKKDFKGSWEDRFDYDYVKRQYDKAIKSGKLDTFNQELMLRIMSEDERLIQDHDIRWYKRDSVIKSKNMFNFYITTDFATSEKQSSDFSVISVWAYNYNGDWFWVDGICKKQTMDKNINDLFRLAQEYDPLSVGIEITGQQGGFIPWIQDQMMTRHNFFNLASSENSGKPGIRPTTNKMVRFNVVVPWFKAGKIYFPSEMKTSAPMLEAMDELSLVAQSGFRSKHDDFSDTISQLALMDTWKPSPQAQMENSGDGLWEMEDDYDDEEAAYTYIV